MNIGYSPSEGNSVPQYNADESNCQIFKGFSSGVVDKIGNATVLRNR
jgi:hypothetical protein